VTARLVEKLGFTPLIAASGGRAVELFRENAGSIACVLLDMNMEYPTGVEVFDRIREISTEAKTFVASGGHRDDVAERFGGRQLTGFLQKPYDPQELRELLEGAMRN
jgi:CheY-like chemotaxis protein